MAKKPTILKSFRLLDFNIYDETTEKEQSDSEGSDNGNKKQYSSKFVIQMFGVNESGETYCLYVNDFNPFFFMIDGFRYGFFGVSDISPWNSLAIVTCFFILVSVVALRLLQKGYKLRN
jgi:hypothetical protein